MQLNKFNRYFLQGVFIALIMFFAQSSAKSQTALEQQCFNAVQGKVAWNQAGETRWGDTNIRDLCKGTTNPSNTIACFQAQIRQHNEWERGINACLPTTGTTAVSNPPTRSTSTNNQATLEQQCFDMVQGKVAYDQAGNKTWSEGNIRRLCKGTPNPSSTISCFQSIIRNYNDWERGISSCQPRNGVVEKEAVNNPGSLAPKAEPLEDSEITRTITIKNKAGLYIGGSLKQITLSGTTTLVANTVGDIQGTNSINNSETFGDKATIPINDSAEFEIGIDSDGFSSFNELKSVFKATLPKNKNTTTFCYEVSGTYFVPYIKTCDGSPTYESKYIKFNNEAGFNANMSLTYYPKGSSTIKTAATETTTAGYQRKVYLPLDADTNRQMTLKVTLLGAGQNQTLLTRDVTAAAFSSSGSACYKTWGTVFSPKTSPCSVSGSARTIKLKNNAGYPASMVVTYYDKDQTGKDLATTVSTNTIEVLQSESIEIPQGTSPTPIRIAFRNQWNGNKTFFTMTASANFTGELCYKIEGTTFAPTAATCDDTVGDTSGDTRQIRFQNDAGYDAQMLVMYFEDQDIGGGVKAPMIKTMATGYINGLGGKFRLVTLPKNTSKGQPITIYLHGNATVKGKDAIFTTQLPADFAASPQPCFKVTGTLFDPSGGKCNQ